MLALLLLALASGLLVLGEWRWAAAAAVPAAVVFGGARLAEWMTARMTARRSP